MPSIVVLYEDSLSKDSRSPNGYVPHLFVLHCVADRTEADPWSLKDKVVGQPRNGAPRLKKDLDSPDKLRPHGEQLIFIADSDRIHEHFGIPSDTPAAMCEAILQGARSHRFHRRASRRRRIDQIFHGFSRLPSGPRPRRRS